MTALWRGERALVRCHMCSRPGPVVVTFDPWTPSPSLDGPFFGEDFLRLRGISVIGVKTARNDWYQHDEMDAVVAAIRAAASGRRRIGYAGSMGAYALLNFADMLELDDVLAVAPQFSPDPVLVPFETRWTTERAALLPMRDRVAIATRRATGHIVYDPFTIDAQHAALIRTHHDLRPLRLGFCGHLPLISLHHARLLTPLLLHAIDGRLDAPEFIRLWRRGRRRDPAYWLNLSRAMQQRGVKPLAIAAARHAVSCPGADPFVSRLQLAEVLVGPTWLEEAIALITPFARNEGERETVRWRTWEWSKLYGPLLEPGEVSPRAGMHKQT